MYISLRHDTWGKWELRNANFLFFSFSCCFLRGTWFGNQFCYMHLSFILCLTILVLFVKTMSGMFSGKLTPQKTKPSLVANTQSEEQSRFSLRWQLKIGLCIKSEEKDKFLPLSLFLPPASRRPPQGYRIAVQKTKGTWSAQDQRRGKWGQTS